MNDLHTPSLFPKRPRAGLSDVYKGKVEQRTDPKRLGRIRVRVEGLFGEEIATEQLPWCWPRQQAWKDGGMFWIPPVGAVVWVEFEDGDFEYPIWDFGFWGESDNQTAQGKGDVREFPSSWFGSQTPWKDGPLKLEKLKEAKAEDAPNSFAFASPLQKRLELDDRRDREKLMLADRHANMVWINSEDGVVTIEAAGGNRSEEFQARGLTLSSNVREQKLSLQLYTHRGFRTTIDDVALVSETATPSGSKLRLTDTPSAVRAELWTSGGYRLVMDEATGSVQLLTPSGAGFDIKGDRVTARTSNGHRLTLDGGGDVTLFSAANIRIAATGNVDISAGGSAIVNGTQVLLNTAGSAAVVPAPVDPVNVLPITMPKLDRSCDSPYYADAEKTA